jgi:signal transduction histidine kinase
MVKPVSNKDFQIVSSVDLKSESLANLSHELRSPLNIIIGFSELIHSEKAGPISDIQKEYLGHVLTSSHKLLRLISDVLVFATGISEIKNESYEMSSLISGVISSSSELATQKNIQVETDIGQGLPELSGDYNLIRQILCIYLSNALKYTPDSGVIIIRCNREDADHFRLEVADNGIGIRTEDFSRLFVEFQQLDVSAAKKFEGSGLGLALAKRIAIALGGKVEMSSVLGEGSLFSVILPFRLDGGMT